MSRSADRVRVDVKVRRGVNNSQMISISGADYLANRTSSDPHVQHALLSVLQKFVEMVGSKESTDSEAFIKAEPVIRNNILRVKSGAFDFFLRTT